MSITATTNAAPMTPVPPILQGGFGAPAGADGSVTGGGGTGLSPELRAAIEGLWSAIGALRGAIEGMTAVQGGGDVTGGGGGASGCGCACHQAMQGAGAMGAPSQEPAPPAEAPAPTPPPAPPTAATSWQAPAGFKIEHPLPGAKLTSSFGEVSSIRNNRPHTGTDLSKPIGTPILSVAPGKVIKVEMPVKGSYGGTASGNYVMIDHGNGWFTKYSHMTHGAAVKVGDIVEAGQKLGGVGSTGHSTGPHLHFEIFKGGSGNDKKVDAEPYLNGQKTF